MTSPPLHVRDIEGSAEQASSSECYVKVKTRASVCPKVKLWSRCDALLGGAAGCCCWLLASVGRCWQLLTACESPTRGGSGGGSGSGAADLAAVSRMETSGKMRGMRDAAFPRTDSRKDRHARGRRKWRERPVHSFPRFPAPLRRGGGEGFLGSSLCPLECEV